MNESRAIGVNCVRVFFGIRSNSISFVFLLLKSIQNIDFTLNLSLAAVDTTTRAILLRSSPVYYLSFNVRRPKRANRPIFC